MPPTPEMAWWVRDHVVVSVRGTPGQFIISGRMGDEISVQQLQDERPGFLSLLVDWRDVERITPSIGSQVIVFQDSNCTFEGKVGGFPDQEKVLIIPAETRRPPWTAHIEDVACKWDWQLPDDIPGRSDREGTVSVRGDGI
jgi:hypothetical protein